MTSVQFAGAVSTLKFTTCPLALGLPIKTIAFRYYPTSLPAAYGMFIIWDGVGTDTDEFLVMFQNGAGVPFKKLSINAHFSTTNGAWTSTADVLTLNQWNSVVMPYDASLVANNPLLYVDGVSKALTRNTAPVGTYRTGAVNNFLSLGAIDGYMKDFRIYDVIKTPAQAAVIAGEDIETDPSIDTDGLVFHAPMNRSKLLTPLTFPGAPLAAGNVIFDRINCYEGVPQSTPVGSSI